ncbi:peptidoglycan-binding protein [Duganella sp. Leaf126]|uniref:LysM peptidoglycan-binding domain-containing protein n=1 Tax=Duganella sp. Leaf126 TaxID=1736266 RepID=UPI0006F52E32|nr:LysM domain-containing protein [Duganella sp. Leaf126]KQQ33784.1 peptidoglycan-binding protein [Duganella sp. Leaf126]
MKNFITVGPCLAAALFVATAATAAAAPVNCQFRTDAPDRHVVVRGDTLWDIADKFLQQPWCWPTVWDLNRAEIANPHWIYPDQVIWFDRAAGRLRLGDSAGANHGAGNAGVPTERRSPAVRSSAIGAAAIASIPSAEIAPFLSQPLIVENDALASAPRIVATADGHVFIGQGDQAYVRGNLGAATTFQVYRPGRPLTDPDSGQVLAHEALYLGTVTLQASAGADSDVHTVRATTTVEEMGAGDRLTPLQPAQTPQYAPHPPATRIDARVLAVQGGVQYAGRHQVVSINRGKLDGLDIGAVLRLYHAGRTVPDTTAPTGWFGRAQQVRLPDDQVGSLFIFRVFNRVSYGLIMQATAPVVVGDNATSPE